MNREKRFVGIDVGGDGAVVGINHRGQLDFMSAVPKTKNKVDYKQLKRTIEDACATGDVMVAMEDNQNIRGSSSKSNFGFGINKGFKYCCVIDQRHEMVHPRKWQGVIWTNHDKIYKSKLTPTGRKSVDTKATSLVAAKRLFPEQTFLKSTRSSKPHDGIVDAVLIAYYCYLKYK